MKAIYRNIAITPKKLNVVAGMVRGKNVDEALTFLRFLNKKGADFTYQTINSAVSNAVHNEKKDRESLTVASIYVVKGLVSKRFRPGPRGRISKYTHAKSHLFVNLN